MDNKKISQRANRYNNKKEKVKSNSVRQLMPIEPFYPTFPLPTAIIVTIKTLVNPTKVHFFLGIFVRIVVKNGISIVRTNVIQSGLNVQKVS